MTLFLNGNGRRLSRKTPQIPDKSHRFRQLFLFSVLAQKFKLMNAGRYSFIDISTTPANRPTRAQHNYLLVLFEDACKQNAVSFWYRFGRLARSDLACSWRSRAKFKNERWRTRKNLSISRYL